MKKKIMNLSNYMVKYNCEKNKWLNIKKVLSC